MLLSRPELRPIDDEAALLRFLAVQGDRPRVVVGSASMAPAIPLGATLILDRAERIRPGDVLVFRAKRTIAAHRVLRRIEGGWLTAGDARRETERVPLGAEIGVVREVYAPEGRRLDDGGWRRRGRRIARRRSLVWSLGRLLRRER